MPTHYVLDQNFPLQVTGLSWPPSIRISRLAAVAPHLAQDHDDWQVLLALDALGDVDGFVTNDADMLALPKEMIALSRTRLALVVTAGVGHEPLQATGLVMTSLQQITKHVDGQPKIFELRPGPIRPIQAFEQVKHVSKRQSLPLEELITRELARMGLDRRPRSNPRAE